MLRIVLTLIAILSGFPVRRVLAQGITDLPMLIQRSVKQLDLADGLPDKCVENAFIDQNRRLWFSPRVLRRHIYATTCTHLFK